MRSVAVRLCDLRTELPRHRGHMLWLCTRPINKSSTVWGNEVTPPLGVAGIQQSPYEYFSLRITTYVLLAIDNLCTKC